MNKTSDKWYPYHNWEHHIESERKYGKKSLWQKIKLIFKKS